MNKDLAGIEKINKALSSLDKMARAAIELSYRTKSKIIEGNISNIRSEFLRDILILREAHDKNLDEIHESLSERLNVDDLYNMISS